MVRILSFLYYLFVSLSIYIFKICIKLLCIVSCFDNRLVLDGGTECLTCAVAKTLQFSHLKSGSAIKPFYIYNKLKRTFKTY